MPVRGAKARIVLPLFSAVFLSDCVSKRVAVDQLSPPYVPHDVLGDVVRFTLAYNVRAAMGLTAGAWSRWILAAIAATMLIGMAAWLFRTTRNDPRLFTGIALVAADRKSVV